MHGDLEAIRRVVLGADIDFDCVRITDEINMPMLWLVLSSYWEPSRIEVGMKFVNFLIAAGADVNIRYGRYGNNTSLLAYATNRGNSTAVAALLEAGADVNPWYEPGLGFDDFKASPVGMAVVLGRRGILLDLLRAGAIIPKECFQWSEWSQWIIDTDYDDAATLSLAKRFVRVADDWAGFVRHHRGVLVSILGKCFGDALPHEVLAEVAAHWAPPGGS